MLTDCHAPFKIASLKQRSNHWVDDDVLRAIYKRDYLFRKAKQIDEQNKRKSKQLNEHGKPDEKCCDPSGKKTKTKQGPHWNDFRKKRNEVVNLIREVKHGFYDNLPDATKKNSKLLWKFIDSALPKDKKEVTNNMHPNVFNFSTIGSTVASKIPHVDIKLTAGKDSILFTQL